MLAGYLRLAVSLRRRAGDPPVATLFASTVDLLGEHGQFIVGHVLSQGFLQKRNRFECADKYGWAAYRKARAMNGSAADAPVSSSVVYGPALGLGWHRWTGADHLRLSASRPPIRPSFDAGRGARPSLHGLAS